MKPAAAAASSPIPPSRSKRRTDPSSSPATAPPPPAASSASFSRPCPRRQALSFCRHPPFPSLSLQFHSVKLARPKNPETRPTRTDDHPIQGPNPCGLRWKYARYLAALPLSSRLGHPQRRHFPLRFLPH